jgi:hypothetical protein
MTRNVKIFLGCFGAVVAMLCIGTLVVIFGSGESTVCIFAPQPDITAYQVALVVSHDRAGASEARALFAAHPDLLRHMKAGCAP